MEIRRYLYLSIIQLMFIHGVVKAQFLETIRSGRPGQSIGAYTVGSGTLQVQSGVDYFGTRNSNIGETDHGVLTATGVRYGLTDQFEVGTFFEYRSVTKKTDSASYSSTDLSNMLIGIRHQISVGKGLLPSIGFQFRLRLPVTTGDYKISSVAPSFIFVTSQQLSESITLITNLGGAWNGIDATPTGTYTINLSCAFTDKFGAFIENYGTLTQGKFETRMDGGVAWLATPNLQLDLFGGFGRNYQIFDYFISTGISWRIHKVR